MALCLARDSSYRDDEIVIWQLSLWPPHLAIAPKKFPGKHLRLVHSSPHAPSALLPPPEIIGKFPCTWPGCSRNGSEPFDTAARLANHRFAAHGIRSSNEESIARQQRRDRKRAVEKGVPPPEYIDTIVITEAIAKFLPIKLPPTVRTGPLDAGERERLRRRLCFHVLQWSKEYLRTPAELAIALAQLAASGLMPTGLSAYTISPDGAINQSGPPRIVKSPHAQRGKARSDATAAKAL